MKATKNIQISSQFDIKRLPVYKEAMDLFALSRKLSKRNSHSTTLHCPTQKELAMSLSEYISTTALTLPLTIAEAQVTIDYSKKLHSQKAIEERVEKILSLCSKLEMLYRDRNHSIKQMITTAHKLQRGLKKWSPQLTLQN